MIGKTNKVIRVRVSEEDYRALNQACEKAGNRKLSDLALETMHQLIVPSMPGSPDGKASYLWIKELANRLNSVQAEIGRLEALLNLKRQ